jgi:NTP pyrophosphatase (non-canonical NTP hydrolase)
VLAQAVKLGEEVGELHAEVLGRLKRQRRSKGTRFDDRSLRGELADVVICVAILAHTTGVDLGAALEEKMAEIDRRA